MEIEEVRELLRSGYRVLLMTRHSERPHIDHDDPTFGMALPLTPHGEDMALEFGAKFNEFRDDVQFMASPLRRTRMTADCIARGMGLAGLDIPTDDILGNRTPYFADQLAVFELFRDGSFFEKVFAYLETGRQTGFADLQTATDALEDWVLSKFTSKFGIFTTHDLYNGAFLVARGVVKAFTIETWVQFLDSAAIILAPDGSRRYAFVRSRAV